MTEKSIEQIAKEYNEDLDKLSKTSKQYNKKGQLASKQSRAFNKYIRRDK